MTNPCGCDLSVDAGGLARSVERTICLMQVGICIAIIGELIYVVAFWHVVPYPRRITRVLTTEVRCFGLIARLGLL